MRDGGAIDEHNDTGDREKVECSPFSNWPGVMFGRGRRRSRTDSNSDGDRTDAAQERSQKILNSLIAGQQGVQATSEVVDK